MNILNIRSKLEVSLVYLCMLLTVLCLSGIAIGVLGLPIVFRTLSVDLLILLLMFIVIIGKYEINMSNMDKVIFSLFFIYAFFLLLHILVLMGDIKSQIITYRMFIMYPLIFSFTIRTLFKNSNLETIVFLFNFFFMLVAVFSIFQFFLSDLLPDRLLTINDEMTFGFYGENIIRPTGLIGNTIIFSGFLLIGIAISYAACLKYKKNGYYFVFVLTMLANILTYSRASFVGSILIVGIIYFIYKKLNLIKFFAFIVFFIALISTLLFSFNDSLFMNRLLDKNESSQGSTATHIEEAIHSLEVISSHPFLGIGLGTQGPSYSGEIRKIITDGFWFQLFVEQGGFLGWFFIIIYISSFIICLRSFSKLSSWKDNPFSPAYVAINVVFILICFLNSSFYNQVNYLLFWIVFFFAILEPDSNDFK